MINDDISMIVDVKLFFFLWLLALLLFLRIVLMTTELLFSCYYDCKVNTSKNIICGKSRGCLRHHPRFLKDTTKKVSARSHPYHPFCSLLDVEGPWQKHNSRLGSPPRLPHSSTVFRARQNLDASKFVNMIDPQKPINRVFKYVLEINPFH